MDKNVLGTNIIAQIGLLVHDIEATSRAYADFFGMEKPQWFWTDAVDKAQTQYKGEITEGRCKLAFFNMGSLQLELIEPDDKPSVWRECLDRDGEGFHHIAFIIEGMQEKISMMERGGMPLLQKGEYTGGRYAYLDTIPQLKVMLELLENDKK
ncbi:VOC family protein [Paenibacillus sedimenti]|uniref:VOC family protein n=1 Tax=Paenibacillus sedimenti TaxID=2770274 RepID=A0A926QLI4_9BACL|nr:VOC family protein [Paenibacillus sedimenti]MBD0383650.1 VOC family protein [Paenibacillus sedimenti]